LVPLDNSRVGYGKKDHCSRQFCKGQNRAELAFA
jgi:hypothetical protein